MKPSLLILALVAVLTTSKAQPPQPYPTPLAVDLTRSVMKSVFESNAVPFVQPMVTTINATSNARFFTMAYVPTKVDNPYFRVSVNAMAGLISEEQKWFDPSLDLGPREDLGQALISYGSISGGTYKIGPLYSDTLGLASVFMRELLRDALAAGYFGIPDRAASLFGYLPENRVVLPSKANLETVLRQRPEYLALSATGQAAFLDSLISRLTLPTSLTLPPGANMSSLTAAVPQLEIGSLYGTELLVRLIPPVRFDQNVGDFSFWGVGLKHSISQYFPERWFDMAVQGVYQGTSLTNTIGVTDSKLEAHASMRSLSVQVGKRLWDAIDIYGAYAYEHIDVTSTYTYVIPHETQVQLGLLPLDPPGGKSEPTEDRPGDQKPQVSQVLAEDINHKFIFGVSANHGPIRAALDVNIGNFNIVSFALAYTFNQPD
ncbi:MAG: hypothetical protein FGM33_06040 [Candidatus Kapabacteria bacterium]|nr:hypothetical protein [Candidatus Kapabacteria bacterium]